jgi:CRISPR system Cascade subunit CasB
MTENPKSDSRGRKFVEFVLKRIGSSTGFRAMLTRADNPATEHQSWEILASWCDIENESSRKPYAVIGASLARAKRRQDGGNGIGRAIAHCYNDEGRTHGQEKDSARAKLRRLIACRSAPEACEILRPILNLCASRGIGVDHGRLLDDLIYFNENTTARWAADFFRGGEKE